MQCAALMTQLNMLAELSDVCFVDFTKIEDNSG